MRFLLIVLVACFLGGCATRPGPDESAPPRWPIDRKTRFYVSKLDDATYTTTYGHGYTWYTAAEELGRIGKPAIPHLVARLDTTSDFERSLVLYALLLASQDPVVTEATRGHYMKLSAWDPQDHPKNVQIARDWWQQWKHLWQSEK